MHTHVGYIRDNNGTIQFQYEGDYTYVLGCIIEQLMVIKNVHYPHAKVYIYPTQILCEKGKVAELGELTGYIYE
jgi:hypothetical protein